MIRVEARHAVHRESVWYPEDFLELARNIGDEQDIRARVHERGAALRQEPRSYVGSLPRFGRVHEGQDVIGLRVIELEQLGLQRLEIADRIVGADGKNSACRGWFGAGTIDGSECAGSAKYSTARAMKARPITIAGRMRLRLLVIALLFEVDPIRSCWPKLRIE